MTAETENPVLDLPCGLRADITTSKDDVAAIRARLDGIDPQLEGWRYVFVATTGSLVPDMKDHESRIATPEGMPA